MMLKILKTAVDQWFRHRSARLGAALAYYSVFSMGPLLLICLLAFVLHEVVAHYDVFYAAPRRHISIWEVHVHNYMATIPLYVLMLLAVLNWETVLQLVALDWSGQMHLVRLPAPYGEPGYLRGYLLFMGVLCVIPYVEENLRCLRSRQRGSAHAT